MKILTLMFRYVCQIVHRCQFIDMSCYKYKCFMSILALQLLQAFNLSEIAHQAYLIQKEEKDRKREAAQRLTVAYVLSDQGFTLAELFGYHLSGLLKQNFGQVARRKKLIRLNYEQFSGLMSELWINMKQYKLFIPILFSMLKGYNNTLAAKDIHQYIQICKAQINPFMAQLKQQISPPKLKEMVSVIEKTCEREDLKGQGFVEKLIIVDIIKKYMSQLKESINIDQKLVVNDEVNYKILLSNAYLGCGSKIRQFLEGKLANKVKRFIKKVATQKKKSSKKKKQGKRYERSPAKKKETKDEKLIRQYMQQNKKQVKQDRKKLENIAKSIIFQCIFSASQISEIETEKKPQYKIKKSIYTSQPVIIEHQLKCLPGEKVKVVPIQHDSGLLLMEGEGKIINLLDGSIRSSFNLNPSQTLRKSPICDYAYHNNILYVIREDGLLFSWDHVKESYNCMVQTEFRYKSKTLQQFTSRSVMFIAQGIIMINCQQINSSLETYSLELEYIGNIFINKQQFGLTHAILKECREMSAILKNLKRDYIIKTQSQYENLIRSNYQFKNYELGSYLFNKFAEISACKAGDFVDWILSYRKNNPLYIDKALIQRLKNKKPTKQDYTYLKNYYYIKQATNNAVQVFLRNHHIIQIEHSQRKANLITLFEDNSFKEIEDKQYLTRKQLLECIEKCSLITEQQRKLFDGLSYNSSGNICMHHIIYGEQYLRILSFRHNRFFSEDYYEKNELPPIIFDSILPFPLLDFFLVTTKFPNYNMLYIISFHNVLINKINLNDYIQGTRVEHPPTLDYCQQSGYLGVCFNNAIIIWNINTLTQKNPSPIKIIKGLEKDRILNINFLYYSNTLATITSQQVKIWDIEQILFSNTSSDIVFKIKPGFKAIQRLSQASRWQPKKKILIRGKSESFFNALTKSNNYVVGVVSKGERATDAYLKIWYLCKFNIMIGSSRQFDQVPTKILRQLDSQARKMKYTERIVDQIKYTETEEEMVSTMVGDYQQRLGQKHHEDVKELSISLINKISNLHSMLHQYSKLINPTLMKSELNIDDMKVFKFNLMVKVHLCQTQQDLKSIFSPQFIDLYQFNDKIDKTIIMDDLFEWLDKTYLSKFLCLLSQIYKYSLPYQCSYIELVYNQKQDKLDQKLIEMLLANSQISKSIIHTMVSLANQLKIDSIKTIVAKIIDKFLPTQYKFPSLRYYKNISKHTSQAPFDYFINRFDQYNRININEAIQSPKKYKDILQHLQKEKLIEKVQQLTKQYPQIVKDNLQLIDICMSYSLITEQEATFYYLAPTNNTLVSLLSNNVPKKIMHNFDSLIGSIVYVLTQQKLRIPVPHFTYQWFYDRFKSAIGNDDKLYEVFYGQLRGSLTQHIAYSSQLQFYIDLNKKNIAINYNPLNWKHLLGTRIYSLATHHSTIKEALSQHKIVSCLSFQKCLAGLIPKDAQTITIRSCIASKNNESFITNFNEDKNLKIYKEDYINLDHFLYYLEQSQKQRQVLTLSTFSLIKQQSLFEIRIPTMNLINQLNKFSGFLTKSQVIQLVSESVTTFTYGGMMEWINSLPFVRMKAKNRKQSRVCAIWEMKKYLKFNWQTLGWILLNKYGKINILNKCIIVEGTIDVKQLAQVFTSEAVFKLFLANNPELKDTQSTYPLELLERLVDKNIINPALQCLNYTFKAQIANHFSHISDVLLSISNKVQQMETDKFVKYFVTDSDTKENIVKLILTNILGRTKRIKIREGLNKLSIFIKSIPNSSQSLQRWIQNHENQQKSLLQKVLPIIEPHQIIKSKINLLDSLIITSQHLSQMIQKDQKWAYSYQPYLTLPQFFDHFNSYTSNENLQNLINNCILKHGIHSIYNSIQQGSFPQFYAKCRSVSKSLSKLTVIQFSELYRKLSDDEKGISLRKLFEVLQLQIIAEERIGWIIQYLEHADKQHINLQNLRISNLIININEPVKELRSLTDALKYEEYLIKRCIKSANKLAFILKQLDDNLMTYQLLTELRLNHDQISILTKYLKLYGEEILGKLRQSESKATIEISEIQQRTLLQEIAIYMKRFDQKFSSISDSTSINVNVEIVQKQIAETSLYQRMSQQNSPQWSCLLSYVNLYHYCKHLLVNNIFRKYTYRQMMLDLLNQSLLGVNLTLKDLYDIFGLAYLDNFIKYLGYFISPNPTHHAIETKYFKIFKKELIQAFIRFDGVNQIKYPINLSMFKQILGQAQLKTQQKSVDYGYIYKGLNIWGCGYVNLNDISDYREKRLANPYIQINDFISQAFPKAKEWRKINPPATVFENRERICNQLIKLEQKSQSKSKIIRQDNLWRILGFYLTKQHRLYIEHQFQSKNNKELYNIVDIIEWISTNEEENEPQNAQILSKIVLKIEQEGGVYNIIRKYNKQIILSQSADSYKQQNAFLSLYIEQSNSLQSTSLRQYIKELIKTNKFEQYLDEEHTVQNLAWLEQVLILIVDNFNNLVRQWSNYNNSLVKFLNELPENQFLLIQSLYRSNISYSLHKLFDILANGAQYFTFTSFWVYNINSDEAYPFSKEEVNEVYKIIDINSDGNISYQQFCRFWCAVQQIYTQAPIQVLNKISYIKRDIFDTFLDSIHAFFEKQIDKDIQKLSIETLENLTNIKHKQKLQRLIKIISPEDIFGLSIDIHKLKVLLKQHKLKRHKEMHQNLSYSNYLGKNFGPEIEEYCKNKQNLQNTLNRWLYFTYPHFGCYLAQLFNEFAWKKDKIIEWINSHKTVEKQINNHDAISTKRKTKNENLSINQNFYHKLEEVPRKCELFYKKFLRRKVQPKQYGKSISYKLYLNKTLKQFEVLIQQVQQIQYFLEEDEGDQDKLIYNFEERQNQDYNVEQSTDFSQFLHALKNNKIKFQFQHAKNIKDNLSYQTYRALQFVKSEIEITNKQLRGKSNNRLSLLLNKNLYLDPKISTSFYDQDLSNMNKLVAYSDLTNFKPLINVDIIKNGKFTSIQSMIKLVDMAAYINKQHHTIGLFVNLQNICIDYHGEKQFKLLQFYGGIKLDADGNYLEGVNPRDISIDEKSIYPPEVYENIFTETFDSYCLAHILYYLFTGEIIQSKDFEPSPQQSHWFNYSQLHYKAKKLISFLSLQEKNIEIQSQIVFFSLLCQCTSFQWHMRPKVHQIAETLRNISQMNNNNLENIGKQLIVKAPISSYCLQAARSNNLTSFTQLIKKSQQYEWENGQISQLRENLPDDPKFYYVYNELLQQTLLKLQENSEINEFGAFMSNVVQYLCQSQKKQTSFLALQVFKDIVASPIIKRYFDYCDQQWKINEFNIHEKLNQLNMKNRINNLPKSSQYYFDLSTLIDTKITLFMGESTQNKNKKHDSTKKIAMTFIQSSLLSHNVNKLCSLQKSGVLLNLYKYLEDPQFEQTVLKIYCLATSCLNKEEIAPTHRAMEEGYKVMMVMHNIINLDRGVKKGQTVVDMLTFMNNYYNFYGEQCKLDVLKGLCRTQICNLPTFTYLFNIKIQNVDLLFKILLNLSYEEKYYKILKSVTVHAYESYLKQIKKNPKCQEIRNKLEELLAYYQNKVTLRELSMQSNQLKNRQYYTSKQNISPLFLNYRTLIKKHMLFYNKKNSNLIKGEHYRYQNNFYEHFGRFLEEMRKIAKNQLQNSFFNIDSCNLIKSILQLHLNIIEIWFIQQETIKYLIELTQKIYEKEFLYTQNVLLNSIECIIFNILEQLVKKSFKIMIKLGFIHFFMRIMKKQHEFLQRYITKGVENIQLKTIYSQQAEFRLNMVEQLLQSNDQDVHRTFVIIGYPKYLIENMLGSSLLLDLRYYKASFDIVPFRYCSPLRSQAITMLSFILPIKQSILRSEVISRLIPVISVERQKLQIPTETPESKMRFVEALWLFGNIIECEDERLKYEFVNNGSYQVINKLLEKCDLLKVFFPKMNETMKTGSILKSSMVFTRMLAK